MEALRDLFAQTVAAGRGARLDAEAARATEARCYRAEAAVEAGLADDVDEPRAAFRRFVEEMNGRRPQAGEVLMKPSTAASAAEPKETAMDDETENATPDDEDQAADDAPETEDEEDAPETPDARERKRIEAIVTSPHAKGRDELARHFAFRTDMPADAALAALKDASSASGTLSQRMVSAAQPSVAPAAGGGKAAGPSSAELLRAKFAKK